MPGIDTKNALPSEHSELWWKLNSWWLKEEDYIYLKDRVNELISLGAKSLQSSRHDFMKWFNWTWSYINVTN